MNLIRRTRRFLSRRMHSERDGGCSVLVVGKAKTGTTFLSKLVQNSLSDCGYTMEPKGKEPILFRPRTGNLVVKIIFEHFETKPNLRAALFLDELPLNFDKKILIVRDPRDEMISRLLYQIRPLADHGKLDESKLMHWVSFLREKEANTGEIAFLELVEVMDTTFGTDFLSAFMRYVVDFNNFFLNRPKDVYLVRYESLVDGDFADLETYLGFQLNRKVPTDPFLARTFRSGSYGSWRSFFTVEDAKVIKPMLVDYTNALGYCDWNLEADPTVSADVCSAYVERIGRQGLSLWKKEEGLINE